MDEIHWVKFLMTISMGESTIFLNFS